MLQVIHIGNGQQTLNKETDMHIEIALETDDQTEYDQVAIMIKEFLSDTGRNVMAVVVPDAKFEADQWEDENIDDDSDIDLT